MGNWVKIDLDNGLVLIQHQAIFSINNDLSRVKFHGDTLDKWVPVEFVHWHPIFKSDSGL